MPDYVREQLAQDIEAGGGIKHFEKIPNALEILLNNPAKSHIYGDFPKQSPERRRLRNLVYAWKKFSAEDYFEKVLIPFVLPHNKTTFGSTAAPPEPSTFEEPSLWNISKDDEVSSTRKVKTKTKQSPSQKQTMNVLGKHMVVPLPKGLCFVGVWAECNLSNLEFIISEDGCSVIQRTKKPNPKDASSFLAHYPWSRDADNVVVSSVDDALQQLMRNQSSEKEMWTETELVSLDKEVIRVFVDNRGKPLVGENVPSVGHRTDEDGRKVITFFLKTVDAHRTSPAKAKFAGNTHPSGMNIGGDEEGSMFAEETVDDVRAEMDERFDEVQTAMQKMMMQQQQTIQQQMQSMMAFMQQMQQQPHPQEQQSAGPIFPDNAESSRAFAQAQEEANMQQVRY